VGSLKGVGKVCLHAVLDTCGSLAFGFPRVTKQPEAAVAVLQNGVPPFCRNLDLNGIEHRRTKVSSPKTHGLVERFKGTVLDEFFPVKMRETDHDSVDEVQADLDTSLIHYNTERLHLGYRIMGRRPVEAVMSFDSQEGQVDTWTAIV